MAEPVFSLGRFESTCYARKHEEAAREFVALLSMLDRNYGGFDGGFHAQPTANMMGVDQDPHIINRICSALSALFSDPSFNLSFDGYRQLLYFHRWIATLFAASSFRNADHILRALNIKGPNARAVEVSNRDLAKFCLLYTPNSEIPMNMEALWKTDRHLAVALACALLSPRFLGTSAAHDKREVLLEWLPSKLDGINDLNVLPIGVLHDVYMLAASRTVTFTMTMFFVANAVFLVLWEIASRATARNRRRRIRARCPRPAASPPRCRRGRNAHWCRRCRRAGRGMHPSSASYAARPRRGPATSSGRKSRAADGPHEPAG